MSQPAARPPSTPQLPTPGSMEQASSNDLTGHSAFCSQGCKPSVNGLWWSLGLGKNLFQLPMVVAWVGVSADVGGKPVSKLERASAVPMISWEGPASEAGKLDICLPSPWIAISSP